MIGEFLRRVTAALEMNQVPYMLTGSLASSMYGIPRATNDVDIVIAPTRQQLIALVQLFQRSGLTVESEVALAALRNRGMFSVIDFPQSFKLDLILQRDREFSLIEFGRRETYEVEGMTLTIASPEDVLIAKLEWAKMGESERQITDAAGIIQMQGDKLDLSYIEHWVAILALEHQWKSARELAG